MGFLTKSFFISSGILAGYCTSNYFFHPLILDSNQKHTTENVQNIEHAVITELKKSGYTNVKSVARDENINMYYNKYWISYYCPNLMISRRN